MPKEFPSNFSSPPSFLFSPSQKCRKISNAISSKACLPPSLPPPLFTQESFVKGEKETAAFQSYFPFSKVRLWESVVSRLLFFLPPWFYREENVRFSNGNGIRREKKSLRHYLIRNSSPALSSGQIVTERQPAFTSLPIFECTLPLFSRIFRAALREKRWRSFRGKLNFAW